MRTADSDGLLQRIGHVEAESDLSEDESGQLQSNAPESVPRFKYNRCVFMAFLPCFIFILAQTGEMLLYVIACGALAIHLLDIAEEKQRSLIAAVASIFCSQSVVIYFVLPLLWNSFMNIFLIMFSNIFSVLTGGWVLLQFSVFIKTEQPLAEVVELMLFTVYPVTCTALMTWAAAAFTHVQLAPYYFTIIGFVFLQLFLTPAPSSFENNSNGSRTRTPTSVLKPAIIGVIAIVYLIGPSFIFVVCNIWLDIYSFMRFSSLATLCFIFMSSVFLTTHLNTRSYLEYAAIEQNVVTSARWISGLASLLTMGLVVNSLHLESDLLPWLPLGASTHAAMGCCIAYRRSQKFVIPSALAVLVFYSVILMLLPGNVTLFGVLPLHVLYVVIFGDIVLVLTAVAATTNPMNKHLSNTTLVAALAVFTLLELLLYGGRLYSLVLILVTCTISCYAATRLYHVEKLTSLVCQLIICLQVGKLLIVFQYRYLPLDGALGWSSAVVATLPLVWLVARFLFFIDAEKLVNRQLMNYVLGIGVLLLMNCPYLLDTCVKSVLQEHATPTELLVLYTCIYGLLMLKLTLASSASLSSLFLRNFAPALLITCVITLAVQLDLSLKLSVTSVMEWWFVMALPVLTHGLCGSFAARTTGHLFGLSVALGLPLGNKITSLILGSDDISTFTRALYCAVYICIIYIVFVLRFTDPKYVTRRVLKASVSLTVVILVLTIRHYAALDSWQDLVGSALVTSLFLMTLIPAVVLKAYSLSGKAVSLESHVVQSGVNQLPLLANAYTISTFILACSLCPIKAWDAWFCCCSLLLFLLQQDAYVFSNLTRRNQASPTVSVTLLTTIYSTLMLNLLGEYKTVLAGLQRSLELFLLAGTIPNVVMLLGLLWTGRMWVNERLVVFLAPLYTFLTFGCSYQSWLVGVMGVLFNGWMMIYKLPLIPDKIVTARQRDPR